MIFLVEDNEAIRETVVAYLELAGHTVKEFPRVAEVLDAMKFQLPRLAIIDVMLPDGNGFVLAQKIRKSFPSLPFLFLTARESESDRITGLEIGADDYVVKPFSPRELVLRVEAILRRSTGMAHLPASPALDIHTWRLLDHELSMDDKRHELSQDGVSVELTLAEWNILALLAGNAGEVVPRERILGECLDYLHDGSDRTINTHIKNLRAKLGNTEWIATVRGFGYKFVGQP
jgi:two-component system phosphate regulon response regulator PhoB